MAVSGDCQTLSGGCVWWLCLVAVSGVCVSWLGWLGLVAVFVNIVTLFIISVSIK